MDDYAKFIYNRDPERYAKVEAGDLSYQLSIKKKLNCKPFSHFVEKVAPDMLEYYPLVDPPPFAKGAVSFVAKTFSQNSYYFHFRSKVFLVQVTASIRTDVTNIRNLGFSTVLMT